jgi:hypothetical protein
MAKITKNPAIASGFLFEFFELSTSFAIQIFPFVVFSLCEEIRSSFFDDSNQAM